MHKELREAKERGRVKAMFRWALKRAELRAALAEAYPSLLKGIYGAIWRRLPVASSRDLLKCIAEVRDNGARGVSYHQSARMVKEMLSEEAKARLTLLINRGPQPRNWSDEEMLLLRSGLANLSKDGEIGASFIGLEVCRPSPTPHAASFLSEV